MKPLLRLCHGDLISFLALLFCSWIIHTLGEPATSQEQALRSGDIRRRPAKKLQESSAWRPPAVGLLGETAVWGLVCPQATAVFLSRLGQIMAVV